MSQRSEELIAAATNFINTHEAWQRAKNRPNPDTKYWRAVEGLVNAFADGEIPAELRKLNRAVAEFQEEADLFEDREDENNLYPPPKFWEAVQNVRAALFTPTKKDLPPPEPIAVYAAMPYMQDAVVCKAYRLLDRNGNPMLQLLRQELAAPGSVIGEAAKGKKLIDGRDWDEMWGRQVVDEASEDGDESEPDEDRDDRDDEAADVDDEGDMQANERAERQARKDKRNKGRAAAGAKCPETPRELWEQGVSPTQAAKMLGQKEIDVVRQFKDWTTTRDFNSKVYGLADQGVPLPEICKQLRSDPKKVESAIRERMGGGAPAGSEAAQVV